MTIWFPANRSGLGFSYGRGELWTGAVFRGTQEKAPFSRLWSFAPRGSSAPISGVDRRIPSLDMKFEVVVIPVSDVDRAKQFYSRLGWRLDADRAAGDNFRLVQFTPPGSSSSIQFGVNLTSAAPSRRRAAISSHTASMRAGCFTVKPERLAGFPA